MASRDRTKDHRPDEDEDDASDLPERTSAPPSAAHPLPTSCDSLLLSFVMFCFICFVVWVVGALGNYREEYAQATEGWRVGTTRSVEITVVKSDKGNLSCSSRKDFWGLRCSGGGSSPGEPGPLTLQPFNTVDSQLLLGAGLWSSLDKTTESLPNGRFTVVCNYYIEGVVKSPRIRFSSNERFEGLTQTTTVGTLSDCLIPR